MNERDDGGPAFPSSNDVSFGDTVTHGHAGLSLRDYFAAHALYAFSDLAVMLREDVEKGKIYKFTHEQLLISSAHFAYSVADAMLKARKQ